MNAMKTTAHSNGTGTPLLAIFPLIFILLFSAACASKNIDSKAQAESLAREALDQYKHGKYHIAVKTFEDIKTRYPFSKYSLLAEIKAADSHYYLEHYDEALALYEQFENNHPTNEAVPYTLFQIGMCYYNRIDTPDRDPAYASSAVQNFTRLIRTYPQSPYTNEAKAKIARAKDFLAQHEFIVASYYAKTGSLEEAANRLEYLLINYPDCSKADEAKELLASVQAGESPKRPLILWLPGMSIFFD